MLILRPLLVAFALGATLLAALAAPTADANEAPPCQTGVGKGTWILPGAGPVPGHAHGFLFLAAPPAAPVLQLQAKLVPAPTGSGGALFGRLRNSDGDVEYVVQGHYLVAPSGSFGGFKAQLFEPGQPSAAVGKLEGKFVVPPGGGPGAFKLNWALCP